MDLDLKVRSHRALAITIGLMVIATLRMSIIIYPFFSEILSENLSFCIAEAQCERNLTDNIYAIWGKANFNSCWSGHRPYLAIPFFTDKSIW